MGALVVSQGKILRRLLISLTALSLSAVVQANEPPSRAWDFNLKTPGTYKVQVEHPVDTNVPSDTKVTYSFQIGKETQERELDLIAGRPHIPLIVDIPSPQKMHINITGLSRSALQLTRVYVFDAATVPPGEYYDPRKKDFKEARQIRVLLNQSPEMLDLAHTKIMIDKMKDISNRPPQNNRLWFAKAESLGWREETQGQESQYLQNVNRAKQH
jgi:hypothetical protein